MYNKRNDLQILPNLLLLACDFYCKKFVHYNSNQQKKSTWNNANRVLFLLCR